MKAKGQAIHIPGRAPLELRHLALDLNGTVALDGELLPGVTERVALLRDQLTITLLSADTRGQGAATAAQLGVQLHRLAPGQEATQKGDFVRRLGAAHTVTVGNGANDAEMLAAAGLGVAVLGGEGLASAALQAADVVVPDITAALDLLLHPQRLVATLRC
jgi:P-type E1-E2 ATPase